MLHKPTVIDLFCGCGGLGLGAELSGFHSLAAVDVDHDLQSAYKLNFPNTKIVNADLAQLDLSSWRSIIGDSRPDGIIGGPPCQGFSRIGLRKPNDPRNALVGHFFRQIKELRPRFFIMENVEGILDASNKPVLEAALNSIPGHYNVVGPIRVNALDCGAATARKRVVVIGVDPSSMDSLTQKELLDSLIQTPATVRDAIGDIPSPEEGLLKSSSIFTWSKHSSPGDHLSSYAKKMRAMPPLGLGAEVSLSNFVHGKISGLMSTKHTEPVVFRFSETPQGKTEPISRYPRLAWNGHCPTLRAGTGSDKGSYQAMRPIHPSDARVITVREAARLQGFPDWFIFHPTIWHSFRMIGNSVSPIMSEHLMGMVRSKLDKLAVA